MPHLELLIFCIFFFRRFHQVTVLSHFEFDVAFVAWFRYEDDWIQHLVLISHPQAYQSVVLVRYSLREQKHEGSDEECGNVGRDTDLLEPHSPTAVAFGRCVHSHYGGRLVGTSYEQYRKLMMKGQPAWTYFSWWI